MISHVEIERLEGLSFEAFKDRYMFRNKPVIVTDAIRRWKALSRWTPEFFKTEFGDMKFTIEERPKKGAGYKDGNGGVEYTMAQFIDRVLKLTVGSGAYFRNQPLFSLFPSLREDVSRCRTISNLTGFRTVIS